MFTGYSRCASIREDRGGRDSATVAISVDHRDSSEPSGGRTRCVVAGVLTLECQPLAPEIKRVIARPLEMPAPDCDEGGPFRVARSGVFIGGSELRGGPCSCCTLDWI